MRKIKLLIVDDSIVFREALSKALSKDLMIEVVATAVDPFDARDKILQYHPDVMTLDVEMPKMNGIEFLRKLIPQYPIPTIVISSINDCVFEAIQLGAVDFIKKPDGKAILTNRDFFNDLITKKKIAVNAKIQQGTLHKKSFIDSSMPSHQVQNKIIAIGASTGGTVALTDVITELKGNIPGIVIVQHIPPVFSDMFAKRLDSICELEVKEAKNGDEVFPGRVLIAPGNMQMRVKKRGAEICVECFEGEKVNGHCPSVDVLFNSVAEIYGNKAIGVIMTGMGYDGAKGLLNMRKVGARTIGQDEGSSVVYGMPRVAYNIGAVEKQVPLDQIAEQICSFI